MKRIVTLLIALLFLMCSFLTSCRRGETPVQTKSDARFEEINAFAEAEQTTGSSAEVKTTGSYVAAVRPSQTPACTDGSIISETELKGSSNIPISAGSDGIINVLVIGNSLCVGWQDELSGMLREADQKIVFYTACHGGTTLSQQLEWLQNNMPEFRLRCYESRDSLTEDDVTLGYCLDKIEWDAISIQETFIPLAETEYDSATVMRETRKLAREMYELIRLYCPEATLLWQQTWALEVGHKTNGNHYLESVDLQERMDKLIYKISNKVVADNDAYLIPAGLAFKIARDKGSGDLSRGDGCHDGEEAGGQFLNACVWYECITGEECRDNPWRPKRYTLSDKRAKMLMRAAHQAVERIYDKGSQPLA